jgi:hypothetical protein
MTADADNAVLQHTVRDGRKFTLEEAIARLAGPGGLKGCISHLTPTPQPIEAS